MKTPWYVQFFDQRYQALFMTRTPERLRFEAEVIARLARLAPGQTVADFCCGNGDILYALQRDHDAVVTGVELAPDYVAEGQRRWPTVSLHQGDALTFALDRTFDVVLNWNSSFGYFDDAGNRALLANMARHLVPGGRLLLEMYNAAYIEDHFVTELRYDGHWQGQAHQVVRTSRFSEDGQRMLQRWEFTSSGGTDTVDTDIQLYSLGELNRLLAEVGLSVQSMRTTPTLAHPVLDEPASCASPRLLIEAVKA